MSLEVTTLKDMDAWFTDKKDLLSDRIGALGVDPVRMTRLALLAISGNPILLKCTPSSIFLALMEAASLKLEPSLGQAYLVPYRKECRLQIGYRGLIDLAQRSGVVGAVHANMVYEKDLFKWEEGTDGYVKHSRFIPEITKSPLEMDDSDLAECDPGPKRLAYAIAHLLAGGPPAFDIMTIPEIEAVRRRAASFKASTSPWITDYDAMAQKTVLRRTLWRRVRSSVELNAAMQMDSSLEGGDPQRLYEIDAQYDGLREVADAVGHEPEEEQPPAESRSDQMTEEIKQAREGATTHEG